jgi:ABC-type multidrug transport system fused ATPase/permease subunit
LADTPAESGAGQALRTLLGALPPERKAQLATLTLLTLVNGAADLAMVGSAMIFLGALAGQAAGSLPALLADWVQAVPADRQVPVAALLFGGSALAANLVRLLYLRTSEAYACRVAHALTMKVHERVFAQPYDYHVRHQSSELIATLQTVPVLASNLVHQWLQSMAALATGLAVGWLLVSIDPLPAIGALAALGLFYVAVARLAARGLHANSAIVGQAYGERVRRVQESLGAIRDLKIDHSEAAQLEDFRRVDALYQDASASTAFVVAAPRYVVEAGAILLVAALAALLAGRDGSALILIGGIAIGGLRLLPLMQQAYRSWAMMAASRAMMAQVVGMLRLPLPSATADDVRPLPFRSSIRLSGVGFRYPERTEPALDGISMTIERGSRIGLAGETGAGKSTLIDLVIGLLRPQAGSIEVDGKPLAAGDIRAWQRNIAHVSQHIFLADASIARNIAFSVPEVGLDMARVRRAAASAAIADFIEALPEGYDTPVGERGVRLSGGQRQRIAIARALYKDAPLLVLDEATNELDEATEATVLANVFADAGRTIMVIAHRPSALRLCDRIVTLTQGRIVSP